MFDGESTPTKPFTFDVASAALKGKRDYQEDSLIASFPVGQGSGFAIVADGIGGHAAGHVASALVTTEVFAHLKIQENLMEDGAFNVPFALRAAAERANKRIADHVKQDSDTKGMGSTLLVPVIRGDRLSWISIGDSPFYLFRDGALRQLNKDHSMAPQIDMMVKVGSMAAEVGKSHPDRNVLTSVVNGDPIPEIDCPATPIRLLEGDILVAASDGLQSLSSATIANILMLGKDGPSIGLVNAFTAAVKELDSPDQDNTTFVVIKLATNNVESDVMDLDAMPVLAQAGDAPETVAAPEVAAAPEPAVAPEPEPDERTAYYYRGQKYYKD